MSEVLNVVGKSVIRKDALPKLMGESKFVADYKMPGMLVGKALRSKLPHAEILSVDTSKAEKLPGVHCVLTAEDVPGVNRFGIVFKDEPVLAEGKVRQVGEAVAIVAADNEDIAREAIELIEVTYKELPAVFTPFEGIAEGAPKVHEKGNLMVECKIVKGDARKVIEECEHVIQNKYTTQTVDHCPIETEGALAYFEDKTMVVRCTSQNIHYNRREVAANLKLPQNKVRILQAVTGGGFGGKLDIHCHILAALLAQRTNRPVKIIYEREESLISTVKRHKYMMDYKTGADAEGRIKAMVATIYADTGAYASYGPGVIKRGLVHATGPYEVPNVYIEAYSVYTNNPKAGAMRGFGVPQVAIAHETQMDIIAEKVGVSPIEVRLRNALRVGGMTATQQILEQSVGYVETLEKSREKAIEIFGERGSGL